MMNQTASPISNTSPMELLLNAFDETWVLKEAGAGNQSDRRKAITQAREIVLNIPAMDFHWLLNYLKIAIAPDLKNSQPYEVNLKLKLVAYVIIMHIRNMRPGAPIARTLELMGSPELVEICNTRKVA